MCRAVPPSWCPCALPTAPQGPMKLLPLTHSQAALGGGGTHPPVLPTHLPAPCQHVVLHLRHGRASREPLSQQGNLLPLGRCREKG